MADHPAFEEYRSQLDSPYHNLRHILKDSGRLDEARDYWKKQVIVKETLVKDYPGNPDHAQALEDVRKELTELDQANAPQKTEPSPTCGTEPDIPKTDPQKGQTEELLSHARTGSRRKKTRNRSEVSPRSDAESEPRSGGGRT